jgi:Ca2+-binding EF-hand superfamily protein
MEFDTDGNGVVTMDEAHKILQKELSFTPKQSIELVRKYDKNGDGELSYEEFVKFYEKVQNKCVNEYCSMV